MHLDESSDDGATFYSDRFLELLLFLFGWLRVLTFYTIIYPTQARLFANGYGRSTIQSYGNIKTPSVTARRVSTLFVSSTGAI
jgi:hypothetical protein